MTQTNRLPLSKSSDRIPSLAHHPVSPYLHQHKSEDEHHWHDPADGAHPHNSRNGLSVSSPSLNTRQPTLFDLVEQGRKERAERIAAGPKDADGKRLLMMRSIDPPLEETLSLTVRGTMWPAVVQELEHPTEASEGWFDTYFGLFMTLVEWDLPKTEHETEEQYAVRSAHLVQILHFMRKMFEVDEHGKVHSLTNQLLHFVRKLYIPFKEHYDQFAKVVNNVNFEHNRFLMWNTETNWIDADDMVEIPADKMMWGEMIDKDFWSDRKELVVNVHIEDVKAHFITEEDTKTSAYVYLSNHIDPNNKERYAKLSAVRHENDPEWTDEVTFERDLMLDPLCIHIWNSHLMQHNAYHCTLLLDLKVIYQIMCQMNKPHLYVHHNVGMPYGSLYSDQYKWEKIEGMFSYKISFTLKELNVH